MDIDLFRDGEQFSTFDSHMYLDPYEDESTCLDNMHPFDTNQLFDWDLTQERELNGDVGLIPYASSYCEAMNIDKISESPPTKAQKIMNDWQQLISTDLDCVDFPINDPLIAPEENDDEALEQKHCIEQKPLHELLSLPSTSTFDLRTYLQEDEPEPVQNIPVRRPRAGVKKIDMKAQKYIVDDDAVDDDDVDVETVSETESSPVLEAGDVNSLLEQFEATQLPEHPPNLTLKCESGEVKIKSEPTQSFTDYVSMDSSNDQCTPEVVKVKQEFIEKDVVKIKKEVDVEVKQEPRNGNRVKRKRRDGEISDETCKKERKIIKTERTEIKMEVTPLIKNEPIIAQNAIKQEPAPSSSSVKATIPKPSSKHVTRNAPASQKPVPAKPPQNTHKPPESTTSVTLDSTKNRQIIDALPRELIDRIKESGKRKPISVIPPIPNKRRGGPRAPEATVQPARSKPACPQVTPMESVRLDHDYCGSNGSSFPKQQKKDSGFESAEEDDRAMMGKQPMVKNADGKLMVSLLKANTIHSVSESRKKKLNLEEYKRRREGIFVSQNSSQNCSPSSSTCSSPVPEDENTRLLKHQEKLMRMAKEVLNTPPKSERKPEALPLLAPLPQPVKIPPNMVKKTLVSIGVNTDFKICKNIDPMAPVEQLEQIKPLLKKANAKIDCNSLITSLIENIPKVMSQCESGKVQQRLEMREHGEDKTIVYLPKDRPASQTAEADTQTNISLIQQCKQSRYRRRRNSSSSSSNSSSDSRKSRMMMVRCNRGRKTSSSSCSSSSRSSHSSRSSESYSSYSSRSPSRSRSRSSSPKYSRRDRERERLREVEERRVIYVGRISSTITREDLRKRFQKFGPITNISLHFRDHGDNYGFVTFANKLDAYQAIEHGNDDPYQPKYDLSFGGRRIFCQTSYSDLDNMRDEVTYFPPRVVEDSFDTLLREAQEKLRKRKV